MNISFPSRSGNTSLVLPKGVVCDKCNNYFAREVEKPFLESDAIRVLRFHQGLESKRRRVPSLTGLITPDIPAIVTLSSTRLYVGCSTDRVIRATDSVEKRPFTFTSLPGDDHLEFTIKCYTDHDGVTNQLGQLKAGDELLLHDIWGAIHYTNEGTFIAGGAGITPFIAIFRQL